MINNKAKIISSIRKCIFCKRSKELHDVILNKQAVCNECDYLTNDFASKLVNTYKGEKFKIAKFSYYDLPPYLRAKKIAKYSAGLPAGIKWNTTTKIMFNHLKTLEKVLEWRAKNKKPIYITVEGESGEGKTNVLIWLLSWMLKNLGKGWKCIACDQFDVDCEDKDHDEEYFFDGIELTSTNFNHFFYVKRSLNLDTRIITKKHNPKDTICVDEFHQIMPHHASTQNRKVIDFVDTVREFPLYLIGATPSAMRLDTKYFAFRNVIQIIVDYTSVKKKWTKFDILVNALGVNAKGERNWQYLFLELDRIIPFQDKTLWKMSRKSKYKNTYGGDAESFVTFNEQERIDFDSAKKDTLMQDMRNALNEASDSTEAIENLLNVKAIVGRRLTYETIANAVNKFYPDNKQTWRTVKKIEAYLMAKTMQKLV